VKGWRGIKFIEFVVFLGFIGLMEQGPVESLYTLCREQLNKHNKQVFRVGGLEDQRVA
jgi:hypothetical protein